MFWFSLILLILTLGLFLASREYPDLRKWSTVPAVLGIILGFASFRSPSPPTVEDLTSEERLMGEVFATRILQDHPGGGGIAVIQLRPGDPDPVMQAIPEAQLAGLRETLGDAYTLYSVDATWEGTRDNSSEAPRHILTSNDFVKMLDGLEPIVAVVSFAGIPDDVPRLSEYGMPPLYAYWQDELPVGWESSLPKGISAVISIRPDGESFTPPEAYAEPRRAFEMNYNLTPGDLQL